MHLVKEGRGLLRVLLIQNVLVLAHALSLSHTVLLALLVPAPLVNLCLGQVRLHGDLEERLLRPVGVCVERGRQLLQLTGCFPLAFADDPLHLPAHLVENVPASLWVINRLARGDHRGRRLNRVAEGTGDINALRFVLGDPSHTLLKSWIRICDHELGRVSNDSHRVMLL